MLTCSMAKIYIQLSCEKKKRKKSMCFKNDHNSEKHYCAQNKNNKSLTRRSSRTKTYTAATASKANKTPVRVISGICDTQGLMGSIVLQPLLLP